MFAIPAAPAASPSDPPSDHRMPMLRTLRRPLVLLGIAVACAKAPPAPPVADGTRQMADTLARIQRDALTDPRANPFLNRARAAALQQMVASQAGSDALQGHFLVAQEQLLAGETRAAIAELEALVT